MLLPFGGKVPRDEGAVFVAPNATVLGDVVLGPGSSVWYGAVLRGDDGTLTLGENTNVQDNLGVPVCYISGERCTVTAQCGRTGAEQTAFFLSER